jgi:ABC-type sulfate transport system substrate-binding protein
MRYRIYIEDSTVDDLAKLEGPTSDATILAGYLEEKTIDAENIEEAIKVAREWAARLSSDVVDYVNVIVEELETGQHRQVQVWVQLNGNETESL